MNGHTRMEEADKAQPGRKPDTPRRVELARIVVEGEAASIREAGRLVKPPYAAATLANPTQNNIGHADLLAIYRRNYSPKATADVRRQARDTLVEIMSDRDAGDQARIMSAKVLLDAAVEPETPLGPELADYIVRRHRLRAIRHALVLAQRNPAAIPALIEAVDARLGAIDANQTVEIDEPPFVDERDLEHENGHDSRREGNTLPGLPPSYREQAEATSEPAE